MVEAGTVEDGFSRDVCAVLAGFGYDDLPEAVVHSVKLFVMDCLGVVAGAADAPGVGAVHARLGGWEGNGSATTLLGKRRLSPPSAALANATAAHALDFDDQHDPARVHSYCVILPAALAAAEDRGAVDGRRFIAAVAAGVEIHARLGLACYNSIGRGWLPTPTMGALAAAVTVGRILELDADRLLDAVGIAYHQASGNIQARDDGALSKRLGPGFAARNGVLAAFLAADGITGAHRPLEGKGGVFKLYERDEVDPEQVTGDLGRLWRLTEFSMKPYPCCRCNHTVIGLGLELCASGVGPDDIEHADIFLGRVNHEAVAGAYEAERDSVVHAQFNAAYACARAVHDGRIDLRSFTRPEITDPEVAALAGRMDVRVDPDIPEAATEPARIEVRLRDGGTVALARQTMKGSPAEPMSAAEVAAKFEDCLRFGLDAGDAEIERLRATVTTLEGLNDVSALIEAFPAAKI